MPGTDFGRHLQDDEARTFFLCARQLIVSRKVKFPSNVGIFLATDSKRVQTLAKEFFGSNVFYRQSVLDYGQAGTRDAFIDIELLSLCEQVRTV